MSKLASSHMSRLSKIQIMIVDNDQKIIELLQSVLNKLGFTSVYGARDGFEAARILEKNKLDLIITDWELHPFNTDHKDDMPTLNSVIRADEWTPIAPKDGAAFIKFVRRSKRSPNPYLSVIMLMGTALKERIEYARDAGVNEVIVKPISAESLCERIAQAVDKQRIFVTAQNYRGPCRRRKRAPFDANQDRRKQDIRIVRHAG